MRNQSQIRLRTHRHQYFLQLLNHYGWLSTKCVEKLQSIQKELNDSKLKIKLDVKTRWNSTLSMINRVLQLMQPINDFIAFYKSLQGKKEFKGKKTTMVQ